MTEVAFAGGNIALNIIPPRSDGGSRIYYYRVEYRVYRDWIWKKHGDFEAKYVSGKYQNTVVQINNLEAGMQYEIRVFGINDLGIGKPGDVSLSPTAEDHKTIGYIDVHCGEGLPERPRSQHSFNILEPFLVDQAPNIQIPYRLEK